MDLVPALHGRTYRATAPIVEPISKIGGRPVFFEGIDAPRCPTCGWNMDFLAQLRLDTPFRLAERWAMVYVFMCRALPGKGGPLTCWNFEPSSGANRLVFQSRSEECVVGALPAFVSDFGIEFEVEREPRIDLSEFDLPDALRDRVWQRTKLGGVPAWMQASRPVSCGECRGPVKFVAQIHDELERYREPSERGLYLGFGDVGIGYVFMCENECSPFGGAFTWQC